VSFSQFDYQGTDMMNSIKNYLPVVLLTTSLSVMAGGPDSSRIPTIPAGFGLDLTGLFLAPGANNLVYAVHTKPLPGPDPNWIQETVDPNYHFTFDIGMQYTFASHIDQIKLNWLYLNSSDDASASASGSDSVAPPYYFGPLAQQLRGTSANSTAKFKVDDVNMVYDHIFNFANNLQLTPFIGVDTAYLKEDITSNYTGTYTDPNAGASPYSITSYNDSKYIGAGPRLGIDADYFFGHGFGITSEMAASVLVGSMQSNTHFLSFGNGNTTPGYTGLANDLDETRVVPGLEGKLGFTYARSFLSGSMMSLELGYLFSTYFDGINQVVPTALVPEAFNQGVIAVETSDSVQSNLDLNGPYLKLTYMFK
jgi:hypothetical protein